MALLGRKESRNVMSWWLSSCLEPRLDLLDLREETLTALSRRGEWDRWPEVSMGSARRAPSKVTLLVGGGLE